MDVRGGGYARLGGVFASDSDLKLYQIHGIELMGIGFDGGGSPPPVDNHF